MVGDSYIQQVSSFGDPANVTINACSVALLNVLANQPWWFDAERDNFGLGGGRSDNVVAALPAIVARAPDICFVITGHNDLIYNWGRFGRPQGLAVIPAVQANIRTAVATLLAAGIAPVLILDPSINSVEPAAEPTTPPTTPDETPSGLTLQQLRRGILEINGFKREHARQMGVLTWDWTVGTVSPTDPAGAASAISSDGIHPDNLANHLFARQGLKDLAPLLGPSLATLQVGPLDVYDATGNPHGNLVPHAVWEQGITGTFGGGFTGSMPQTGWNTVSAMAASGKTLTAALVPDPDGLGLWQQLGVGGTGNGGGGTEVIGLQQDGFAGFLPPGTQLECFVEVAVPADSPFAAVFVELRDNANTRVTGNWWGPGVPGFVAPYTPGPAHAWRGIMRTPVYTVPATGFTGLSILLQAIHNDTAGTFSGSVRFRRPTVRVLGEPYP